MADQASQVDPAFGTLLADPRVALRAPPAGIALADVRGAANAFLARAKGPGDVPATDLAIDGRHGTIPVRLYNAQSSSARPAIVFVHGGGFVLGNLDSHDAMCRSLAQSSGAVVIAADYALAPEYPFPRPLQDVADVVRWVRGQGATFGIDARLIALAGDSAGGQLALAAALEDLRAGNGIAHVGLLYPLVDPSQSSNSARVYGEGHMLTGDFVAFAWHAYAGPDPANLSNPQFDLRQADWRGFPPTTIVTAQCDPLHDEAENLARDLAAAAVAVELRQFPGMIHGFAGLPHITPKACEALEFLGTRMAAALDIRRAPLPIVGEEE